VIVPVAIIGVAINDKPVAVDVPVRIQRGQM